jgi:hypothetical protein
MTPGQGLNYSTIAGCSEICFWSRLGQNIAVRVVVGWSVADRPLGQNRRS